MIGIFFIPFMLVYGYCLLTSEQHKIDSLRYYPEFIVERRKAIKRENARLIAFVSALVLNMAVVIMYFTL